MRRTEPGHVLEYVQKWLKFIDLFNDELPEIPIYSNVYFDFYTPELQDYFIAQNETWGKAIIGAYLGDKIEENFVPFMESHKDRLADCEYMIPDLVSELIGRGEVSCDILSTTAVWHGVTYREDKPAVVKAIKSYVDSGIYPKERFAK